MVLSNTAIPKEYAKFRDAVLDGYIPVCKEIAMEMNRTDFLIDSPDYYYDDEAIDGFIAFCENEMTLADGSDLSLLPSFKLWAESLLAWYHYVDEKVYNQRLHRYEIIKVCRRLRNKQFLIVARGAAKSMYAALLQAYFLTIDQATTHQVVIAPTMVQAEETIMPIRTAIARAKGPVFQFMTEGSILSNTFSKVKLASTKKGIQNFMTDSLIEVRPMSIRKVQGLKSKVATIDEWLSGDIKEDVIGAVEQGASKIDDYVIIALSSEGTARNGPGDTIKMELLDILTGEFFSPHVSIWYYRLDSISEIADPDTWLKANPNIGATVSYEAYIRDVERAEKAPASRSDIIAKRFGIPVEGYTKFFTYEQTLLHPPRNFDNSYAVMGGDLSQGDDFCAFTFLIPLSDGRYGVKTRSYVSESKVMKLPPAMRMKYEELINEGSLVVMDGLILDMMKVYDDLDQFIIEHQYTIVAFGYDPYNASNFVDRWISEHGEYGTIPVRQGVKTESVPLGELSILAEARYLLFDEELMKFAMGNAIAIEDNNGNRKLSKRRATEKIDNVAALVDAWVAFNAFREVFDI